MRIWSRLLALAALPLAGWLLLAWPPWSPLQLCGHGLLALALPALVGGFDAFLWVSLGLALQGSDPSSDSAFRRVFLPLWVMLAIGGLLASLVVRRPSLGRRIEHGPLGPGGI